MLVPLKSATPRDLKPESAEVRTPKTPWNASPGPEGRRPFGRPGPCGA